MVMRCLGMALAVNILAALAGALAERVVRSTSIVRMSLTHLGTTYASTLFMSVAMSAACIAGFAWLYFEVSASKQLAVRRRSILALVMLIQFAPSAYLQSFHFPPTGILREVSSTDSLYIALYYPAYMFLMGALAVFPAMCLWLVRRSLHTRGVA